MTALFASLLGEAFGELPHSVRALHGASGCRQYHGEVEVTGGAGWVTRLCARLARLPPTQSGPIRVEIAATATQERWTRHFGGHAMPSTLWRRRGRLCERLGPIEFAFRLAVEEAALEWRITRVRVFAVPLPSRWFGDVRARAFDHAGRYGFDVSASLPLVGRLVHYRGWLDVG